MAQKTKTINGKRVTAATVQKQMVDDNKLDSGMYLVSLEGQKFGAGYYYNTDAYYIPDDIAPDGVYIEDEFGMVTHLSL